MSTSPDHARERFEEAMSLALTQGRADIGDQMLGVRTWSAIEAIAEQHPDASANIIAEAYDAFEHEHGRHSSL